MIARVSNFVGGKPSSHTTSNNASSPTAHDVALATPPADSISSLAFSPTADWLAVSSWDATVKIYDLSNGPPGQGRAEIPFGGPALSCHWSPDGQKVVGGGIDCAARLIDLSGNGVSQQVAAHDAPIRSVRFFNMANSNQPMLVTGSWDKSIRYWDLRQSTPAAVLPMPERVWSMDVRKNLLAVATAGRTYTLVDLTNPTKIFETRESQLKMGCRVIVSTLDAACVVLGGVDGRISYQAVEEKDKDVNFTFKCHREAPPVGSRSTAQTKVYAINDISMVPRQVTLSTAGADGNFNFWDVGNRARTRAFTPNAGGTISATAFNSTGAMFAYAVSYDWSMGHSANTPQYPNKVMLHPVDEASVLPKNTKH